jgi:hypothetical protein
MNPAQGMAQDGELPGSIAENDRLLKPALRDQARPPCRFGDPVPLFGLDTESGL